MNFGRNEINRTVEKYYIHSLIRTARWHIIVRIAPTGRGKPSSSLEEAMYSYPVASLLSKAIYYKCRVEIHSVISLSFYDSFYRIY